MRTWEDTWSAIRFSAPIMPQAWMLQTKKKKPSDFNKGILTVFCLFFNHEIKSST
jgi:hypothetical protein